MIIFFRVTRVFFSLSLFILLVNTISSFVLLGLYSCLFSVFSSASHYLDDVAQRLDIVLFLLLVPFLLIIFFLFVLLSK